VGAGAAAGGENQTVRPLPGVRRVAGLVRRALAAAAHDRITTSAAGLAFHWFLAAATAVVAAVGIVGLVGLSPAVLARLIKDVEVLVPVQLANAVDQALQSPGARAGGWVAAVVGSAAALWSAVESMAALQVGLDIAYEVGRDPGFLRRRLRAVPLAVVTVVLGGAAFALLVLGDPIRSLLPASFPLARSAFDALFDVVRWAGALVLVVALLTIYYRFGPNRPPPRRWLSAGAVAAAVVWMAASAGFSFYLSRYGHESRTYGAFAGVAVLLLWLYLAGLAVLFGAELDRQVVAGLPKATAQLGGATGTATGSRASPDGTTTSPSPTAPTR
jgi:membrane protein